MITYVTFRSVTAAILALIISVWYGNHFIKMMKAKNIEETQRKEDNPKKGVPPMGGVIIIVATIIPCLLVSKLHNIYLILMIVTMVILGSIGFADDYIKTFKKDENGNKRKDGIKGWVKVAGQVVLGLIVGLTLRFSPAVQMNEKVQIKIEDNKEVVVKSPDVKSTRTTIPFFKENNLNYANLFKWAGDKWMYILGWGFFVLITVLAVAAVSNGSNLNDGKDGLAAGNTAIMAIVIGILAYISSNARTAGYFDLMFIPGTEEIVVFLSAFVGALLGYLWYNCFPAQVFMGDTGSLTIGGILAVTAVIIHKELLLPIICGVFLVESLSVIIQRYYYKFMKRKGIHQRVWRRTPIHDHFTYPLKRVLKDDPGSSVVFLCKFIPGEEEPGNNVHAENKVTVRFWIVSILCAALALLTLKIR